MLRKSSPPIEPRRCEAPITATLRGSKNGRREATTASWSRASTRSRYRSVDAIGNCTSSSPPSSVARQLEAGRLEDAEHGAVVGQHRRHEALDPDLGRACRELLEQTRADAPALMLVGHGEGCLGQLRVAETHVVGDGDDAFAVRVGERAEQRPALVPVGLDSGSTSRGPSAAKPWKRR